MYVLILFLILFTFYYVNCINYIDNEHFTQAPATIVSDQNAILTPITTNLLKTYIYNIYTQDVSIINKLADFAKLLQTTGLQINSGIDVNVNGEVKIYNFINNSDNLKNICLTLKSPLHKWNILNMLDTSDLVFVSSSTTDNEILRLSDNTGVTITGNVKSNSNCIVSGNLQTTTQTTNNINNLNTSSLSTNNFMSGISNFTNVTITGSLRIDSRADLNNLQVDSLQAKPLSFESHTINNFTTNSLALDKLCNISTTGFTVSRSKINNKINSVKTRNLTANNMTFNNKLTIGFDFGGSRFPHFNHIKATKINVQNEMHCASLPGMRGYSISNMVNDVPYEFWINNSDWILSDIRTKENIKVSDTNKLLVDINKLTLTNYNFIYSKKNVYGFIAQNVKEVIPEAVSISTDYLPNINKKPCKIKLYNNTIILYLTYNLQLKHNDFLKLIINNNLIFVNIIDFDINTITVNKWDNFNYTDDILVYGTRVDDFHSLDHSYLGILGIGCLQEITKRINNIKASNIKLRAMIYDQQKIISKLDNIVNKLI